MLFSKANSNNNNYKWFLKIKDLNIQVHLFLLEWMNWTLLLLKQERTKDLLLISIKMQQILLVGQIYNQLILKISHLFHLERIKYKIYKDQQTKIQFLLIKKGIIVLTILVMYLVVMYKKIYQVFHLITHPTFKVKIIVN